MIENPNRKNKTAITKEQAMEFGFVREESDVITPLDSFVRRCGYGGQNLKLSFYDWSVYLVMINRLTYPKTPEYNTDLMLRGHHDDDTRIDYAYVKGLIDALEYNTAQ